MGPVLGPPPRPCGEAGFWATASTVQGLREAVRAPPSMRMRPSHAGRRAGTPTARRVTPACRKAKMPAAMPPVFMRRPAPGPRPQASILPRVRVRLVLQLLLLVPVLQYVLQVAVGRIAVHRNAQKRHPIICLPEPLQTRHLRWDVVHLQ